MTEQIVYIGDAEKLLNRRQATIRGWERRHLLPSKLMSERDGRGRRFWTLNQIEKIKEWMVAADMRPGKALPHYNPTPEQVERHIQRSRRPRPDDDYGSPLSDTEAELSKYIP